MLFNVLFFRYFVDKQNRKQMDKLHIQNHTKNGLIIIGSQINPNFFLNMKVSLLMKILYSEVFS